MRRLAERSAASVTPGSSGGARGEWQVAAQRQSASVGLSEPSCGEEGGRSITIWVVRVLGRSPILPPSSRLILLDRSGWVVKGEITRDRGSPPVVDLLLINDKDLDIVYQYGT